MSLGGAGVAPASFSLSGLRDRLLASPRFRDWAAAFPLTRPIARRRARDLFDVCAGFVYSQVLAACFELGLFDILARGPQEMAVLARRLRLAPDAAERLIAAAASLRLVRRRGSRVHLGPLGAATIGNPGIAAMVRHHAMLYADLQDPVALLRGGLETRLGAYWAYAGREDAPGAAQVSAAQVGGYTALMAASQPMIAAEVLDAYDVARHRCLLDVGGGDGTFLAAAAARAPSLQLHLFDLPAVAEQARRRLPASATVTGGSFLADSLPTGADLISLIRVVHDHDDAAVRLLLRRVHEALPPGGTLLLAEPMAGTAGAAPVGDAYFGFYLLAMGQGRPRTPDTLRDFLAQAGFAGSRLVRTRLPMLTRLIVATRGVDTRAGVNPS